MKDNHKTRHLVVPVTVVALCAAVAAAAEPQKISGSAKPARGKAIAAMMAYAPREAIGVVHVNVGAVRKEVAAAFKKNEAAARELKINAVLALVEKVESMDLFLLASRREPMPVIVLHGTIGPKDVASFATRLAGVETAAEKGENGRYAIGPMEMIVAPEAKDVSGQAVLLAPRGVLSDQLVAGLGKGRGKTLKGLLAKVDTTAQVWGGLDAKGFSGEDEPRRIVGSMNLTGKGSMKIDVIFAMPGAAGKFSAVVSKEPFAGTILVKCTGATVTLSVPEGQAALTNVLVAITQARYRAKRAVSMANLNAIGKGILIYEADHDRRPPSLGALTEPKHQYLTGRALVSPFSERKLTTDAKGVPVDPGDYIYLVLPASAPDTAIMAYEKPEYHGGKGTVVLWASGSIQWVEMAQFKKMLAETKKLLEK